MAEKEYKISIDPRILELLGPSLYTNIYYILSELIANAYDANAKDVYIIQKDDAIIVEDNGTGMSYSEKDIDKYLNVGKETRITDENIYVEGTDRKRMGRKGVGKLAALAVSSDVLIMTQKNNEKSGFILSRHVNDDHKLKALEDSQISFEKIITDGTSVVMTNPQYKLHKTAIAIKNNLLKIFPLINSDFKIHIITDESTLVIENFDQEMIQELGALITLDKEYEHLSEYFEAGLDLSGQESDVLLKNKSLVSIPIKIQDRKGVERSHNLEIKGWIGAYRTTRDRKLKGNEFQDNFVSLLSNGKLGEYNILPTVGKNRLPEVYVVGQLHIDLFEETSLPDMALSNRQGYKTDDIRYQEVESYIKNELLPEIVEMRVKFGQIKKDEDSSKKLEQQRSDEALLKEKVTEFKDKATKDSAKRISKELGEELTPRAQKIIEEELNESMGMLGIKKRVDSPKKKLLISHASNDKALAEIVYKMLLFNGLQKEDIIYTSSTHPESRVPNRQSTLDYLREFFVESYSDKKPFIVYVTSEVMVSKWYPVLEVGAMWITQNDHEIFNIRGGHTLKKPLNIDPEYHVSEMDQEGNITMDQKEFSKFVIKIASICEILGIYPKSIEQNNKELSRYVTSIDPQSALF